MAHNINTYIGREAAWHALGTVTGKYMTWAEILAHGGLDFSVFKSQLRDGKGREVDAYGMFRWDKKTDPRAENTIFLGSVGKDYTAIHHAKGFETLDVIVGSTNGAHYETAGVLGNGEVVWGCVNLQMTMHVGQDELVPRVSFVTSYNGSIAHTYKHCVTRPVCANTVQIMLSEKGRAQFRVKHTKNGKDRLASAHDAIQAISADVKTIEQKLNFLAGRKVTKEAMVSVLDRLFPKSKEEEGEKVSSTRRDNVLIEVLRIFEENDNNAFPEQRGSAYNLLNAITNYTDHERATKNDGRAESAMFGSGDQLKSRAFTMLMDEAQALPELVSVSPKLYSNPVVIADSIPDSIDDIFGRM